MRYWEIPSPYSMFEFPLVIAPTIVMPLFVVMNGLVAWWLFKTKPVSLSSKKSTTILKDKTTAKKNQ